MRAGGAAAEMRILVLSPRPAHPPNTGAKLREYHLLRQMSQWAKLTVLAFRTGPESLRLEFADVESFARPRGYTVGKILRGMAGGQALSILNYRSEEMAGRLREHLKSGGYDAVLLEALHMAAYEQELADCERGMLRIWDWHNIESELMERYAERAPTILHSLYARETARRLKRLELSILGSQDGHLVCSEREAIRLRGWVAEARVAVVPNGVDCAAFATEPGKARTGGLLFVGSLDYHPNVEGLKFFTREVWPTLRQQRQSLRLRIVGSRPVPEVLAMGTIEGVEVVGPVEKVEPYYADAEAALVPLFSGGGTRLKVLEAFAAGVPVFSTAMGMEGIAAQPGVHYIAAETAKDWVAAVLRVGVESVEMDAMAQRGKQLAEQRYDWEAVGREMESVVRGWLGKSA